MLCWQVLSNQFSPCCSGWCSSVAHSAAGPGAGEHEPAVGDQLRRGERPDPGSSSAAWRRSSPGSQSASAAAGETSLHLLDPDNTSSSHNFAKHVSDYHLFVTGIGGRVRFACCLLLLARRGELLVFSCDGERGRQREGHLWRLLRFDGRSTAVPVLWRGFGQKIPISHLMVSFHFFSI